MSTSDWAKHEVELACELENSVREESEFLYGRACYESALKAYLSLCEDGHSGLSFGITKKILIRLMNGLPLTPIKGNDEDWRYCFGTKIKTYQCKRMSGLFKNVHPDGSVTYEQLGRCYCVNEDDGPLYESIHSRKLLDEYVEPITMPYIPNDEKYVFHVKNHLTLSENGYLKTLEYLFLETPNGIININRYFKETDDDLVEISMDEFISRTTRSSD